MTGDGFAFEFSYALDGRNRRKADFGTEHRFAYNLEWGPVSQDKNLFAAPADTGSVIDLATAEKFRDYTSRVTFEHYFAEGHEWGAYIAPMELIEFDVADVLTGPTQFAGVTFVPLEGTVFEGRYNFLEFRVSYRYRLVDTDRWTLRLGGGAQYAETYLRIKQFAGDPRTSEVVEAADARIAELKPFASARVAYRLNSRWRVDLQVDGYPGSDSYLNAALLLN